MHIIYTNIHIHDIHIYLPIYTHHNFLSLQLPTLLKLSGSSFIHSTPSLIYILHITFYTYHTFHDIHSTPSLYTHYSFLYTHYTFLPYTIHSFLKTIHIPFWTIHSFQLNIFLSHSFILQSSITLLYYLGCNLKVHNLFSWSFHTQPTH